MSSEISSAATFIKKQQPVAEYTHCHSDAINLPIGFARKNKSIQKFVINLTTVIFLIIHRRDRNTLNYSLVFMVKSCSYMKLKGETSLAYLKQDETKDIELMKTTIYFISLLLLYVNQFLGRACFNAYLDDKFEEKLGMWIRKPKHRIFMLLAHRLDTLLLFLFSLMV